MARALQSSQPPRRTSRSSRRLPSRHPQRKDVHGPAGPRDPGGRSRPRRRRRDPSRAAQGAAARGRGAAARPRGADAAAGGVRTGRRRPRRPARRTPWPPSTAPASRSVINPDWATGMGSSLRAGLYCLDGRADAAVVSLVDQPGMTAADRRAAGRGVAGGRPRGGGDVRRRTAQPGPAAGGDVGAGRRERRRGPGRPGLAAGAPRTRSARSLATTSGRPTTSTPRPTCAGSPPADLLEPACDVG